ncbi:MAG: ComEC/Rec2 family competence protein [Clostridia bacterium]|nr:ComEC/Rec2 family competence protein [Clostridia bacterium]
MKKIINLRLPALFAVVLALGAVAGYFTVYYDINYVWLTATVITVAVSLIALCTLKFGKKALIISCVCLILFGVSAFNCITRLNSYQTNQLIHGAKYEFSGTVIERAEGEEGFYVTLNNVTANGERLRCKLKAFIHETVEENCEVGRKITCYTQVEKKNAFDYGNFNSDTADNVRYYCRVYYGVTSEKGFYPFGEINTAIRQVLFNYLDYSTASIATGMITGNTEAMEEEMISNFRYGGIAHIFAVSGLHIGVIYSALTGLFKKLKCNKYVSVVITLITVLLYSGVCGFTPSSVRSVIMCSVLAISKLIYGKYDGINSIAIAGAIILLINPLRLFSLGFQLSFGAVASIFLLNHTFNAMLKKLPEKLIEPLATSLSVQIGTLPIMLNGFGYLSIAGIFLNLIAIPVLSFLFIILFFCVFLSIIIPPIAGILIGFAGAPLQLTSSFFVSSGMENAILKIGGVGFLTPLWYIAIFALCYRINLPFKVRVLISSVTSAIMVALAVLSSLSPLSSVTICVTANYGGEGVIFKSRGESVLVLTEDSTQSFLLRAQNEYVFSEFDAVVVLGGEDGFYETVMNLYSVVNKIYVSPANIAVAIAGQNKVLYEKGFTYCGTEFLFLDEYSIMAKTDGVTTIISAGEKDYELNDFYCDLLISNQVQSKVFSLNSVYFTLSGYKYNIYDFGDLIFNIKNGKIKRQGILPFKESLY